MSAHQRVYSGGRNTGRWTRGKKISSLSQAKRGDVLYMVNHQFKADNLIRVTDRMPAGPREGIDWAYADPALKSHGTTVGHMWPWEVGGRDATTVLYKAAVRRRR